MDLQKILDIFEEHGFNENNCSFFRQEDITDIAKEIEEAINYTRCSTQLNTYTNVDKPIMYKGEKYKIMSIDYFKQLVNINDLKTESRYIKNVPFKDCTQSV